MNITPQRTALLALAAAAVYVVLNTSSSPICPATFSFRGDVYVINMTKHSDRLAHFAQQFNRSDLSANGKPFIRWDAVDGSRSEIDWKERLTPKALEEANASLKNGYRTRHYQIATPGAVGCFLSHYRLWISALRTPAKEIIVFEDDAIIDKNIVRSHLNCVWPVPRDADVVLFSHFCASCPTSMQHPGLLKVRRFFSTAGYLVTRRGMQKLTQLLDPRAIAHQIDSAMSLLAMEGKITIYAVRSLPVRQSQGFVTSIQHPIRALSTADAWQLQR